MDKKSQLPKGAGSNILFRYYYIPNLVFISEVMSSPPWK